MKGNKKTGAGRLRTYTDANSEGFNIAVQPAAKAGATFHVAINSG